MKLNPVDAILSALSIGGALLLLAILLRRRLYRLFPIFTFFIFYSSISDLSLVVLFRHLSNNAYFAAYFADKVPEFLLQLGVLIEVGWNVFSPVKRSLPRASVYAFAFTLILGTILALLLSLHSSPAALTRWSGDFVQLTYSVAILRLVIFTGIACFSQMLGISWKNHVLQLATGFVAYSLGVLLIELTHRFLGGNDSREFHVLGLLKIAVWCTALGYWSYTLVQKEAPRKEFSPKMMNFLVLISGANKSNRLFAARLSRK